MGVAAGSSKMQIPAEYWTLQSSFRSELSSTETQGADRSGQEAGAALWAFVVAAVVLVLALGVVAVAVNPWLEYERSAVQAGQWWRLLTAHVAHLDLRHAALNAAGLMLIAALGGNTVRGGEWAIATFLSLAAVDAGLYWWSPQVGWYVGASGLLHGLLAAAGVFLTFRGEKKIGLILLVLVSAKIMWESHGGGALSNLVGPGIMVVTDAHTYGAIGGVLAALAVISYGSRKSKRCST